MCGRQDSISGEGGGCKLTITSEQCCGTMLQARIERLSFDQKIISSFFIGGNEIVGGERELKLVHGERHCRKNQVCRGNVFSFFPFFFFSVILFARKKKEFAPIFDANKSSKSNSTSMCDSFERERERRRTNERERWLTDSSRRSSKNKNNLRTCNKKTEKSHFE